MESRVLGQDATMDDVVTESVRQPSDPPEKSISWAQIVTKKREGGILNPNSVLDATFVSERVKLCFPNGKDGEPVITVGDEVLAAMNGLLKNSMVVKVVGRSVSIANLSVKLRELWRPIGEMVVLDLPRNFFMVRFEKEDDFLSALTGGPWKTFGSYLLVQSWSPDFNPLRDEITTTPVWVRLLNIPVNFYHKAILMGIAKGIGKPVKVDMTTIQQFMRVRFVRICVEVNLKIPLKRTMLINGDRYFVSYERLTNICFRCGIYGHAIQECRREAAKKMDTLALQEKTRQAKS